MTVHVHRSVSSVDRGKHHHKMAQDEGKKGRRPDMDTERTWAFDCEPECERSIVDSSEFASNHPGGVNLTHDEELHRQDIEASARVEQGHMFGALAEMAREHVAGSRRPKAPDLVPAGAGAPKGSASSKRKQ